MAHDRLFLIDPGFEVTGRDDGPFVCPFCNQIEGLLASFPQLSLDIEVVRVAFPRPRQEVVALVGEANQGLPLLILGDNSPGDARVRDGLHFVSDTERILELLAERHRFPRLLRPATGASKVA
ncbi:hypothetical protein ASG47_16655 [Devosia sp. Leaf420]|uniref:DUF3088 domain-containing protein n=1 Tax=Devosia sp. Leaf420 TaxID=1736374 RepID=UPI000713F37C|nr:DUF3088 domain-containing protein [Devosia sp. Leaf420]KQT44191.1 hypothetical protein ASG47_16655 [Devosia sp. Leaf420]